MALRIADSVRLNTPEEVSEYLAEAVSIFEAHDLDPVLHAPAFAQVIALLAQRQVQVELIQGGGVVLGQNGPLG